MPLPCLMISVLPCLCLKGRRVHAQSVQLLTGSWTAHSVADTGLDCQYFAVFALFARQDQEHGTKQEGMCATPAAL
jgi:hypothetical protein